MSFETSLEYGNRVYMQFPPTREQSPFQPRSSFQRFDDMMTSSSNSGFIYFNGRFCCVCTLGASFLIAIVFFTLGGMGYTGLLACNSMGSGLLIGGGLGSFVLFAITCCCCFAKSKQNKHFHYERE